MMSRACLVGVVALTGLVVIPLGVSGASDAAGVKSITISGSISGISGGQVLVLSAQGIGWTGVVHGRSFRVLIPSRDRAKLRDATVQVIAASRSYVGPVVLQKRAEKKKGKKTPVGCGKSKQPACIDDVVGLGTVSGNISLGRLVGKDFRGSTPTWYLALHGLAH